MQEFKLDGGYAIDIDSFLVAEVCIVELFFDLVDEKLEAPLVEVEARRHFFKGHNDLYFGIIVIREENAGVLPVRGPPVWCVHFKLKLGFSQQFQPPFLVLFVT